MKQFIVENFINARKLVVLDNGKFEKIIIEENFAGNRINNIYRGRIQKIIPSMNAVFVDVGEKNPGFMKLDELNKHSEASIIQGHKKNLFKQYKEGDNILVQLIKEQKGDKRAKFTPEISIQGKYVVYIPSNDKIVFSNKIKNLDEKERLKKMLYDIQYSIEKKDGIQKEYIIEKKQLDKVKRIDEEYSANLRGYIFRTESYGIEEDLLKRDIEYVNSVYNNLIDKYNSNFNPECIYRQESVILTYIRNNFDENVEKIICAFEPEYNEDIIFFDKIKDIVRSVDCKYFNKIINEKGIDVFEVYGINNMLKKYKSRKVWFGKGAYIVIDKTEAMTIIDVNSGRHKNFSGYDYTVFNVNLDAVEEIANQIIVRDISGIIIIDFIDMKSDLQKNEIITKMNKSLSVDERKYNVYGFTNLGLMEISRMRKENSFEEYYMDNTMSGLKSINQMIDDIERIVIFNKYHLLNDVIDIEFSKNDLKQIEIKNTEIKLIEKKYKIKLNFI